MTPESKPDPVQRSARPWGEPPVAPQPIAPKGQPPGEDKRRRLGRNSLVSILFAILIIALWGGRAYQDLSSPSAWAYWKDLYFSPAMTASVVQVEVSGPSDRRRALAVKGEIGAAAASWFRDKLDEAKLVAGDIVVLSSPGGRLDQALIMGEIIRSRGLTTVVGKVDSEGRLHSSYCASACVLAYAGGKVRLALSGSAFGVHQFTTEVPKGEDSGRDLVADTQKTTGMILEYMTRMGVSPSILQQMSATKDIRWLKEKEALDLKLATKRFVES
jgi:hypothetical protein